MSWASSINRGADTSAACHTITGRTQWAGLAEIGVVAPNAGANADAGSTARRCRRAESCCRPCCAAGSPNSRQCVRIYLASDFSDKAASGARYQSGTWLPFVMRCTRWRTCNSTLSMSGQSRSIDAASARANGPLSV